MGWNQPPIRCGKNKKHLWNNPTRYSNCWVVIAYGGKNKYSELSLTKSAKNTMIYIIRVKRYWYQKTIPRPKKNFGPYMPSNFPSWCLQPIWKILVKCYHFHSFPQNRGTLQGTNMSHLGKKKIIFERFRKCRLGKGYVSSQAKNKTSLKPKPPGNSAIVTIFGMVRKTTVTPSKRRVGKVTSKDRGMKRSKGWVHHMASCQ